MDDLNSGRRTLVEALQAVEDKFPVEEYRAFIGAIALSIEQGSPLVTTLGDMSGSLQAEIENELLSKGRYTATPMMLGMEITLTVTGCYLGCRCLATCASACICLSIPLARTLEMLPVNCRRL